MTSEKGVAVRNETMPASFEEIKGMAEAFTKSGFFQDTKAAAQAIVKIQAGRELGLPPVYSMQNINMIRNRLTTSANTLALLVKSKGRYNYRVTEHDENKCTIVFYEKDDNKWVEVGTSTFTMEDAKRAQLVKPDSGWVKFPRAMLFSRAISQGARIYCPDAIGGVYTDEEIRAVPPAASVTVETDENTVVQVDPDTGEIIDGEAHEIPPASPVLASSAQLKKMFATMKECGYTEEQLKAHIKTNFNKTSSKELTKDEASMIISDLQNYQVSKFPEPADVQENLFPEEN